MSTTAISEIPFGTQLIGQTEKALGGILDRLLDGTGLSERHWVSLRVVTGSDGAPAGAVIGRLSGVFTLPPERVEQLCDELVSAGMVTRNDGRLAPTAAGRALHDRILAQTGAITDRLWGDLPEADLEVAGRVLRTVLARVNALGEG